MIMIEPKAEVLQTSPRGMSAAIIVAVMPMTPERIGRELDSAEEEPCRIKSLEEAFERFKPTLKFSRRVGAATTEFQIETRFRSIEDFNPESFGTRRDGRNDLADLKDYIEGLRRAANEWKRPSAQQAWQDPKRREELLTLLGRLRSSIEETHSVGHALAQVLEFAPGAGLHSRPTAELLASLDPPFSVEDTRQQTISKIEKQIGQAEQIQRELLRQAYEAIRPVERSFRTLAQFFANSTSASNENATRAAVELFIFNSDLPTTTKKTLVALENFVRQRNDNFNFRDDVFAIVVPGFMASWLREALEEVSMRWGALLFSDLDDERTWERLRHNLKWGDKYAFLKSPDEQGVSHCVLVQPETSAVTQNRPLMVT